MDRQAVHGCYLSTENGSYVYRSIWGFKTQ